MNENEFFISNENHNNINELINFPPLSYSSSLIYKMKQLKFNKENYKNEYEELNQFRINNNEKSTDIIGLETGFDNEFLNKIIIPKQNLPIDEEKKIQKLNQKCGRKKKNSSEEGKHNKYSGDNLIRKCKRILLHYLYVLINNIIEDIYKNEKGYNKKTKRLLKINQFQIANSDVNFNKEFLNKKLKDIFSDNVTLRCKKYGLEHNKILINKLLNEEDNNKRLLFTKIFNLTFFECLEHFRGTNYIKELDNLVQYEDICKNFEIDEDYLFSFKYYIENYEKIIKGKNARRKKEKQEKY